MEVSNQLFSSIGLTAMVQLTVVLICIVMTWWSLQMFRFDLLMRNARGMQAKSLQVLLSIAIGHQVGQFIFDYILWSRLLKYIA